MTVQSVDNRARILEYALRLFATRGYHAVGVQEVCDAARVTKPTLYHYFGSKRGLLEALFEQRCVPFLGDLATALTYQRDLPLTLQRTTRSYFRFATQEPVLYRLLLGLWFSVPDSEAFEVIAAFNERQQRLVEAMFQKAAADHGNMRGRHRIYAATFLGMINTHIGAALNGYLKLTDAVARQAVKQFSHGIYS
jgi:AcrR family transcriptional regulator